MLNKYPLWKNLVIVFALVIGFIYALPNFFPDDYAIQITGARGSTEVDQRVLDRALGELESRGIEVKSSLVEERDALIRLTSSDDQLRARPAVQAALGREYLVALNMAPSTPGWLQSLGAGPMKLGLDLRGGVHFLLEVDMDTAVNQRLEALSGQIKRDMREERIRYRGGDVGENRNIILSFRDSETRAEAFTLIRDNYNEFLLDESTEGGEFLISLALSEAEVRNIQEYALEQNLTTIRNRVNELGVAEPLVQRQGASRIIVELPGVQDTAQAKRVLGLRPTWNSGWKPARTPHLPKPSSSASGMSLIVQPAWSGTLLRPVTTWQMPSRRSTRTASRRLTSPWIPWVVT